MQTALTLLPELNFLRDFHVTQAGVMAASAFGGMKDAKTVDYMHPGSVPEAIGKGGGGQWRIHGLDSEAAEQDFRLAVRLGLVSQTVFAALTA